MLRERFDKRGARMNIVLAGASGLFRDGIARLLRDLGDACTIDCVDEPTAPTDSGSPPDLLVLDADAWSDAPTVLRAASSKWPSARIVLLVSSATSAAAEQALADGAAGCIEKSVSSAMLIGALRLVLAGGIYLPASLLAPMQTGAVAALDPLPGSDHSSHGGIGHLTPRQLEVLALAARGASNKEIARRLDICEGTVKLHLSAVYKALKVKSRGQASNAAARMKAVVDTQVRHCLDHRLSISRILSHATRRQLAAGQILFRMGDPADALYYLVRGTIHLVEIDLDRGPGCLLGEMGLFSSDRRRACTARCRTDCEVLSVTAADAMQIYYQDPDFAVYVTHLITRRLTA